MRKLMNFFLTAVVAIVMSACSWRNTSTVPIPGTVTTPSAAASAAASPSTSQITVGPAGGSQLEHYTYIKRGSETAEKSEIWIEAPTSVPAPTVAAGAVLISKEIGGGQSLHYICLGAACVKAGEAQPAMPTPAPTPTPTLTPAPTATPTATPTPTPSASASASATPTATPTSSPSASPTATPTATPSPSPTPIATPTPAPTATATPTPTPSASVFPATAKVVFNASAPTSFTLTNGESLKDALTLLPGISADLDQLWQQLRNGQAILGLFDGGDGQTSRLTAVRVGEVWTFTAPSGLSQRIATFMGVALTSDPTKIRCAVGRYNLVDGLPVLYISSPIGGRHIMLETNTRFGQ